MEHAALFARAELVFSRKLNGRSSDALRFASLVSEVTKEFHVRDPDRNGLQLYQPASSPGSIEKPRARRRSLRVLPSQESSCEAPRRLTQCDGPAMEQLPYIDEHSQLSPAGGLSCEGANASLTTP